MATEPLSQSRTGDSKGPRARRECRDSLEDHRDSHRESYRDRRDSSESDRSSVELPTPKQSPHTGRRYSRLSRRLTAEVVDGEFDPSVDFERLYSTAPEVLEPERAIVKGKIPSWLTGTLLRNGPGKYEVNQDSYRHLLDPLAMIQRYHIDEKCRVYYSAQYLETESYKINEGAGRIVVGGFGTYASPDPKKNFIARHISQLCNPLPSDNDVRNVLILGDDAYTSAETGILTKIHWDTRTISPLSQVLLQRSIGSQVKIRSISGHPHYDRKGNVYNLATSDNFYCILKLPSPSCLNLTISGIQSSLEEDFNISLQENRVKPQVLGRVPFQERSRPSHCHGFGMCDNYFVFFEIPFFLNQFAYFFRNITGKTVLDCLEWNPKKKTVIHLLNADGLSLPHSFHTDPMFLSHNINTFEESGCLLVDLIAYRDPSILHHLQLELLRKGIFPTVMDRPQVWRFVLPLAIPENSKIGDDLVKTAHLKSRARSVLQKDNRLYCTPELLTDKSIEYPRINYGMKNGEKYRYCYGLEIPFDGSALCGSKVLKVDVQSGLIREWCRDHQHQVAGEAVFVQRPGASEEDDGVLLVPVSNVRRGEKSFLAVLDAADCSEVARAEVKSQIPMSFHGEFLTKVRLFLDSAASPGATTDFETD